MRKSVIREDLTSRIADSAFHRASPSSESLAQLRAQRA
jgi:hypothetical protein